MNISPNPVTKTTDVLFMSIFLLKIFSLEENTVKIESYSALDTYFKTFKIQKVRVKFGLETLDSKVWQKIGFVLNSYR